MRLPRALVPPRLSIVFLLTLIAYTNSQSQKHLVCKHPGSRNCLSWIVNSQTIGIDADAFSTTNIPHFCGLSDIRHISSHGKYIKVRQIEKNERLKKIYCNKVVLVGHLFDWKEVEKSLSIHTRVRRQNFIPRGKYRGQTQSQYLAIDRGNGKDEGRAEAHSAADSSRASVSGNSGMGQAQSQSIYDSNCDDCYGKSDHEIENLKRPVGSQPGDTSYSPNSGSTWPSHEKFGPTGPIGSIVNGSYRPNGATNNGYRPPGIGGGDYRPSGSPASNGYGPVGSVGTVPTDVSNRYDPHSHNIAGNTGPGGYRSPGVEGGSAIRPGELNGGKYEPGTNTNGFRPSGSQSGFRPDINSGVNRGLGGDNYFPSQGSNDLFNHRQGDTQTVPRENFIPKDGAYGPGNTPYNNQPIQSQLGGSGSPGTLGYNPRQVGSNIAPNFGNGVPGGTFGPDGQIKGSPVGLGTSQANWPIASGPYPGPGGNVYCCVIPNNGLGNIYQNNYEATKGIPNLSGGQTTYPSVGQQGPSISRPNGQYGTYGSGGTTVPGVQYIPDSAGGSSPPVGQYIPSGGAAGSSIPRGQYITGGSSLPGGQYIPGSTGVSSGPGGQYSPGGVGGSSVPGTQYIPGGAGGSTVPSGQYIPGTSGSSAPGGQYTPGGSSLSGGQYIPASTGGTTGPGGGHYTPVGTQYIPGGSGGSTVPGGQYIPGSSIPRGQYTPGGTGGTDNTRGPGGQYIPGGTQYVPGGSSGSTIPGGQYIPGAGGSSVPGVRYTPGGTSGIPGGTDSTIGPGGQYTPGRTQYVPGGSSGSTVPGGQYISGAGGTSVPGARYTPGVTSGIPGGTDSTIGPGGQYTPGGTQYVPGGSGGSTVPGGQYIPGDGGLVPGGQYVPGGTSGTSLPGRQYTSGGPDGFSVPGGQYVPGGSSVPGGQYIPAGAGGSSVPTGQYIPGGAGGSSVPGGQYVPSGAGGSSISGGQYVPSGAGGSTMPGGQYIPSGMGGSSVPGGQYVPSGAGGSTVPGGQYIPSGMGGSLVPGGQYIPGGTGGSIVPGGQYTPGGTGGSSVPGGQYIPGGTGGSSVPGGQYVPGGTSGSVLPGGQYTGGGPGGQYIPGGAGESLVPGGQYRPGGSGGSTLPGGQYGSGDTGGSIPGRQDGQYPQGYYNQGGVNGQNKEYNGVPQNYLDPNTVSTDEDDSEAEANVAQNVNGTTASASSKGGNVKGRAQTSVQGTYSGSGSFQAQAQITGENKEAQSEVNGGKKGASSSASGSGRNNKSQANVQLGSETGSVQTQSQSNGIMHSSNSQVQGSVKGGMADAQARGPGSTSSQAQIGFTPYKDEKKSSHDIQRIPFTGGGMASAQSSGRTGQSQSQLHGTFKYGITYNGAAQSGASLDKDAVFPNRLSFEKINVFDENNKNINVDKINTDITETPQALDSEVPLIESSTLPETFNDNDKEEIPTTDNVMNESMKNSESRYAGHAHIDRTDMSDSVNSTYSNGPTLSGSRRSFQTNYGNIPDYEFTTDKEETPEYDTDVGYEGDGNDANDVEQNEYSNYDEYSRVSPTHQYLQSSNKKGIEVRQTTGGNTQHILLGSLKDHNAEIIQKDTERPDENKVYLPGERVPGTGGYTIPVGFTGSVKSVASKDKTYVVGSKDYPSQAQTVSLTPGKGKVKYTHPSSYGKYVKPKNLRSLQSPKENDNRYVSVSKSVTRALDSDDNIRKQYSHTYYTKSSSCGYFTFTCTMVSSAEGRKKVCKPKMPTNPDGTPIRC